jgi:hypothetical protein
MVSFNELCDISARQATVNPSLREACARPRSAADETPLPEPNCASSFDSAWEALLTGTGLHNRIDG